MSVVKKGNVSVQIIEVNRFFDPRLGAQTEIIYQGLEAAIEVVAAQAIGFGARSRSCSYHVAGPVYRASVLYGDAQDGAAEIPVDRWERITEYYQEPITQSQRRCFGRERLRS